MKEFHDKLEKLRNKKAIIKILKQKKFVYDNASGIYNNILANYELQYADFSDDTKIKRHNKYKFKDFFLEVHNYNKWFDIQGNEESDDEESDDEEESVDFPLTQTLKDDEEKIVDIPPTPPIEGEVKEGKLLKILTPNKPDFQYY